MLKFVIIGTPPLSLSPASPSLLIFPVRSRFIGSSGWQDADWQVADWQSPDWQGADWQGSGSDRHQGLT